VTQAIALEAVVAKAGATFEYVLIGDATTLAGVNQAGDHASATVINLTDDADAIADALVSSSTTFDDVDMIVANTADLTVSQALALEAVVAKAGTTFVYTVSDTADLIGDALIANETFANATSVTPTTSDVTVDQATALDNFGVIDGLSYGIVDTAVNVQTELDAGDTLGILAAAVLVTATGTVASEEIDLTTLATDSVITASDGDDLISGGTGDDIINAGLGADVIFGGIGSDVFRIASDDITSGVDLTAVNLFGDFTTGEDTVDLSGFVFKNLAGTDFTSEYGADVVTSEAVELSSASRTDTTILYSITSTVSSFNSTQTSIDTAVTEIIADASTLVFAAGKLASVLIQVVGLDGNDVALFHYTEAGSNGIQEAELDLLGVFVSADVLVAADIL